MGGRSIDVEGVKGGSEIEKFREKELEYVGGEVSDLNERWVGDRMWDGVESGKERYVDRVGEKMEGKGGGIGEGVIVMKEERRMEEVEEFGRVWKEGLGMEGFEMDIEKEEG